ncbi:hypothetical protein [Bowmanella denitrificans]|uniref:hypothetical protein n=1 Tax=Bowmanella denitrificans TaxID=366582 RepID=UPI000C9B333B|nr:hypothetical protein [Bowmanella denitrificans]
MTEKTTRLTITQIRKLKSLSDAKKFENTSEQDIARQIALDPDLYELTDEELAQFELVRKK